MEYKEKYYAVENGELEKLENEELTNFEKNKIIRKLKKCEDLNRIIYALNVSTKLNDNEKKQILDARLEFLFSNVNTNNKDIISELLKKGKVDLTEEQKSKLGIDKIIKESYSLSEDPKVIYEYLLNEKSISEDMRKEAITKIIHSLNMKYIILCSIYIEPSLINIIFESKERLFIYVISTDIFESEEKEEIMNELFKEKINPDIESAKKVYQLTN